MTTSGKDGADRGAAVEVEPGQSKQVVGKAVVVELPVTESQLNDSVSDSDSVSVADSGYFQDDVSYD